MSRILLSAGSDSMSDLFIFGLLCVAVINLLIIIKFFEIGSHVRKMLLLLMNMHKDMQSQSTYIPTKEDFQNVIVGTWKSKEMTFVITSDGNYENKVQSQWDWGENYTSKGTWKIEGYYITFSPIESTKKDLLKAETYVVMNLAMSNVVLRNNENNSQITLSRI